MLYFFWLCTAPGRGNSATSASSIVKLPAEILLTFGDGHQERRNFPADARFQQIEVTRSSRLKWAEVDPGHKLLVDLNWSNNGRTVERNREAWRRLDCAALFWIVVVISFQRI